MSSTALRRKKTIIRSDWDSAINPGPTAETVSKIRPDVILALYQSGKIDGEMRRAAESIMGVFEQVCRGMFPRAVDHAEPYSEKPTTLPAKGMELMLLGEINHWREVYKPWSGVEATVRIGNNRPRTELVHHVVVDNRTLRETEGLMKMRNGTGLNQLRDSLRRYCVYAGWY